MSAPRRTRSLSLVLAAGSAPVLLALSLHSQPTVKPNPPANEASLSVALLLDSLAQNRFQDTNMRVFGLSRMGPQSASRQHPMFQLTPRNPNRSLS